MKLNRTTFVVFLLFVFLVNACSSAQVPVTGASLQTNPTPTRGPVYLPVTQNNLPPTATVGPAPTRTPTGAVPTIPPGNPPTGQGWYMTAGNPARTSWTPEEVTGSMRVEWYRPIEAYISQNVQLIASEGLIFASTSRGLVALHAHTGELAWRFDTQLPLGNSPTVINGIVYVGGYDRKIHALRATNGQHLWSYAGAKAGFSTNPLVVDGKVIAGNRDGSMYAIGAHGTPQQGQLVWKFDTGGLIDLSAAYKDGVVYFASNDNYAYAVRVTDGARVWKSAKLPGDGYQSYWPVIHEDRVVFATAAGYRTGLNPGTASVKDAQGNEYGKIFDIDRDALFPNQPNGSIIGAEVSNQGWAQGKTVLNFSRVNNYMETHPHRRAFVVLNRSNGSEYTFDSDGDGRAEVLPAVFWGTHSGNTFPPVVGSDNTLYLNNIFQHFHIPQGRVMGWKPGTALMSQVGGQGAVDEPQALSMGGNVIYRVICCDRVGDWFYTNSNRSGQLWSYVSPLSVQIPGYDQMWYGMVQGDSVRLQGNYGTQNGIYHTHGDQNPLIPYGGRLYVHRSNAIIAYGPGSGPRALPRLNANNVQTQEVTPTTTELKARLEKEIEKMVDAGRLRPGYYNGGQTSQFSQLNSYFENPGDTLYTVAIALPHLSPQLQTRARAYLKSEFQTYFDPHMIARIGWNAGAAREAMPIPSEPAAAMTSMGNSPRALSRWSWQYPPFNFYALSKYAAIFPEDAVRSYDLARAKLEVPAPADNAYLIERPYEMNAYIAGYTGFLRLQEQAGRTTQDSQLRASVTAERDRLMQLRASSFSKDTPYVNGYGSYHSRTMNIARNFLFMTPELGTYLNANARSRVDQALTEYNNTAPYWFVTRYNAVANEGVRQHLYDVPALYQAKAYIMRENRAALTKYLDVPAFERGDLFYIQNLVIAIEAP
jgi:hypothetical protein